VEQQLPTVRALAALWQEVSRKPLFAPPNFFRYLRLRARFSLRQVDAARVRVAATPGKVNDCSACTEICCVGKRSAVLLRLRDIATLIDIERTDLMTSGKPSFSSQEVADHPALERHLASTAWQRFPMLRQDRMGACAALTREGRCSLFPHWPLSCSRFPYALRLDSREVFFSRRCDAFWIRPDAQERVERMKVAAVAGYNERIRDAVLLAYAPARLEALGLMQFLR